MSDKNPFGGGNKNSLYTPMSETEQEVLARLIEAGDFQVRVIGWGYVDRPRVTFGDLRVTVSFRLNFDKPEVPMPVHYFDLELWAQGIKLFGQRQTAIYNNQPLQIAAGVYLDMMWDIAVNAMDPAVVKQIKPGVTGLTSRWVDKDTGLVSEIGNTHLSAQDRALLLHLRQGERIAREDTLKQAAKATQKSKSN